MRIYLILALALSFILISCGQNGGNAVRAGSGDSPFPTIKADCSDTSCV